MTNLQRIENIRCACGAPASKLVFWTLVPMCLNCSNDAYCDASPVAIPHGAWDKAEERGRDLLKLHAPDWTVPDIPISTYMGRPAPYSRETAWPDVVSSLPAFPAELSKIECFAMALAAQDQWWTHAMKGFPLPLVQRESQ